MPDEPSPPQRPRHGGMDDGGMDGMRALGGGGGEERAACETRRGRRCQDLGAKMRNLLAGCFRVRRPPTPQSMETTATADTANAKRALVSAVEVSG